MRQQDANYVNVLIIKHSSRRYKQYSISFEIMCGVFVMMYK